MTLDEQIDLADRLTARHRGEESAGLAQIARTLRWLERWQVVVREAVQQRQRQIDEMRSAQEISADEAEAPSGVDLLDDDERECVGEVLAAFEGATVRVVSGERL